VTYPLPRRAVHRASAVLLAGALAACTPNVVPPPSTSERPASASSDSTALGPVRLLVLVGTPHEMRLAWLDGAHETSVPLPVADVQWVSGSAERGLVATAGPAGRIFVAGPFQPGDAPAWREIAVDASGRQWLGQPLADGVASPSGDAIAVVAADPASGFTNGHLVILDPSGGPSHARVLPGRWDGRAPAWLPPGRVAISTRDGSDATGLTIVDPATGRAERWGTSVAAFAVAGDGGTLAWQDRDDRRVQAGSLERALAGGSGEPVPLGPSPRVAAQILLDATGRRLGVAWLDDAGDTIAYAIYAQNGGGWALEFEGALPRGTSRVVLVSLGP
jgi:hypothetical protein